MKFVALVKAMYVLSQKPQPIVSVPDHTFERAADDMEKFLTPRNKFSYGDSTNRGLLILKNYVSQ